MKKGVVRRRAKSGERGAKNSSVPAGDKAKSGSRRAEEGGNGSRLKKRRRAPACKKRGERSQELQRARRG
ncbi:hypothetical protein [Bianquea renquensis]|uniref:Uncharacterized protein n=1 Tax=Bianquea renquensis TaxID=2763661 RepID=A0A926HYR6_9FIRM|nr:hypothetical protein [Bianquea renquensis]MBC8545132.1 hypothetical protein [Bianquea renquensis]